MSQGNAVRKTELQSNRDPPNASPRSPKQLVFSGSGSPLNRRSPGFFSAIGTPRRPPGTRSPPGIRNPTGTRSPAGARSPLSDIGQLSPRQDLEVGLEDSRDNLDYHRGSGSPRRQRHQSVRCVDVLIYYSIVVSTFLLYSVGFIAYKLDEDPGEVKEFYRTMTTSAPNTIFNVESPKRLEGDDQAVTATESINDVAGDTSTDAVTDANEVEQRQRYIVVPHLTPKAEAASPSPSAQASSGYSMPLIHEGQDGLGDTFVHLLRAVTANEKDRNASQHGATPVRGVGTNGTTVPFLTFPGLSQW